MALLSANSYTYRNKTVYYHGGEHGVVQDYLSIRKEMLQEGKLFEDDQFPADNSSLYLNNKPADTPTLVWKRPPEFAKNGEARFIVDGMSRFDVKQGFLGNCWILAAIANLPSQKELWDFVVPQKQSFQKDYTGVFHFRFWRQGYWTDVVIDDRLPTTRGQLYYVSSADKNEFWSALLEKAYAKMFGSYEALAGGETIESMIDLSGGVPEVYHLKEQKTNELFHILRKASKQSAWLTCSTNAASKAETEEMERKYGIMPAHAYTLMTLTKVRCIDEKNRLKLVRIRNPWGGDKEWKGAFKDCSSEWDRISEQDRRTLNLDCTDDGEYWMLFQDFMKHFSNVEMCHLKWDIFSTLPNEFGSKRLIIINGSWSIADGTAGGNLEDKESFKKNPRYSITFEDCWCDADHGDSSDDSDDSNADNGDDLKKLDPSKRRCTMVVTVMQKNRRQGRKLGMMPLKIGFYVYHIPNDLPKHPHEMQNHILDSQEPLYRADFKSYYREVSTRIMPKIGTYLIVPSTDKPDLENEFMIRILTDSPINSAELF